MVNAYVATEAGMQGAVLIGSMSTGILNMRPALFEQFKALMTEAMTALVEVGAGGTVILTGPEVALHFRRLTPVGAGDGNTYAVG